MNVPSHDNALRRSGATDEARFASLLDEALRSDLEPRFASRVASRRASHQNPPRRHAIDVTHRVLVALGFRPLSSRDRRTRLVRRQGSRLLQAALLAAAALGGVALHNISPQAVHRDDALPRAVDRALHRILPADLSDMPSVPGDERRNGGEIDRMLRDFDQRLLDRLRSRPAPGGDDSPSSRIREAATAPYRWL